MFNKKGFTLIELLVSISIVSILATAVFTALDPMKRFKDSRDAKRDNDTTLLINAINLDKLDHGGVYLNNINNMVVGDVYMIGTATTSCDDQNTHCLTDVSSDTACVDLNDLVNRGYLGEIPVSPSVDVNWNQEYTGYTLSVSSTGLLTVRACEAENTTEIYKIN